MKAQSSGLVIWSASEATQLFEAIDSTGKLRRHTVFDLVPGILTKNASFPWTYLRMFGPKLTNESPLVFVYTVDMGKNAF